MVLQLNILLVISMDISSLAKMNQPKQSGSTMVRITMLQFRSAMRLMAELLLFLG